MPAPKNPSTAAATAARWRIGDNKAAARLREHGWIVIPPERAREMPSDLLVTLLAE